MAVAVLKKGTAVFPHNTDLLAGVVLYSTKIGSNEKETEENLLRIPKEQWNWRAFTFYIDAVNNGDRNNENYSLALDTAEEYIRILPNEERAYMAKYGTLERYGEHEKAKAVLEEADQNLGMTAQCSFTLCEIYKMEGAYEEAIRTATKAIISTAESQPSVNISAALAERAFSRDALVQRDILSHSRSIDDCIEDMQLALEDYQIAEKLGYRHDNIIQTRIRILNSLIHPRDINESSEEMDDETKKNALLSLMALLNMNKQRLDELLSSLQKLSPITQDNHEEYLQLFYDAAEGDQEKAKQIQILVENIFM